MPTNEPPIAANETPTVPAAIDRHPSTPRTLQAAGRAYALNGRRSAVMGAGVSGDPAWNILLDLFVSECEARSLCVTSVCIGSRASAATALRYLAMLRGKGLVVRIPDPADRRRTFVRLTDRGWNTMVELLEGEGGSGEPPQASAA